MPAYPLPDTPPDMDRMRADLAETFASRERQQAGFAELRIDMARMRADMAQMKADIMRTMWLRTTGIIGVLGTLMMLFRFL